MRRDAQRFRDFIVVACALTAAAALVAITVARSVDLDASRVAVRLGVAALQAGH